MKRSFLALVILCFIVSSADAQMWKSKRYEATAGLGPSFFFGDIGGFSKSINILGIRDLSFKQTRFNFNANFKYRIIREVNLRVSFTTGLLNATDSRGSNETRGYAASIFFMEPAFIGEYYFIKNSTENSYLFSRGHGPALSGFFKSLDFYVFTGFGGVSYSITPNLNLETHGLKKSGFAPVIPAGIGATLIFSPNFNFGTEITGRYAFSDNLDGYTSQYSSSNDVYYFFNFTITYKMKTGPKGWPSFK